MEADETCDICQKALSAGYRYIDTASYYGNEEGVGKEKTPASCR
ncbi:MAG: aldo/keto reductase [Spirochaetales bacterium]|nr:aldo/keto reductase [Spirochaetales bacterium]